MSRSPHLDRPFDYLVPEGFADRVRPGSRVRVRFAGQLVDGYVLERAPASEHAGRLAFIERSVSPEVVLTAEVAALARAVADRWAGTLADVLRLAVPPRHAQAETAGGRRSRVPPRSSPDRVDPATDYGGRRGVGELRGQWPVSFRAPRGSGAARRLAGDAGP